MKDYKKAFEDIRNIVNSLDSSTKEAVEVQPDKYGFYPISTKYGGREVDKYNKLLKDWSLSLDPVKKRLSEILPKKVIVNYELTNDQVDPVFRYNNNRLFMIADPKIKTYDAKENPASMIVFLAVNPDGFTIEDHFVATASNYSYPSSAGYKHYLSSVEESCIRYANTKYKLIISNRALRKTPN
jgi:hypothetical protein